MRESLFSPLWFRVAGQHPYLRVDVRVQRSRYRDQVWYVLIDDRTGRHYRVDRKAYQVIGRCDGRSSVQQLWDALLAQLGDDAPTQDEMIRMLSLLNQQGLLGYEATPDVQALVLNQEERAKKRRQRFLNPFAFRIPLGDPARLLQRCDGLARAVCNPVTLWIWVIAVAAAVTAAAANWHALSVHAGTYMATPHYLLLAWLCFPVIKTVHELGHALAVRRWGGEVHSVGVTLFVLTPAPYVDASASAGFRARYQRVVVGAIGIMIELAIAAAALCVWLNVQPGLARDLAFVTMFIASVSTVLFNGNPLLPFDGYYVMCDALDLPNLGTRSKVYWSEVMRRLTSGVRAPSAVQTAEGERKWLIAYAPLAAAYRLFLSVVIVLWIGGLSFVLGVAAAAYVLVALLFKPAIAAVRGALSAAPAGSGHFRVRAILGGTVVVSALVLGLVPFPFHTSARGVVWLPEQAQIRPQTDGFVTKIMLRDGARVEPGEMLLTLEDPMLLAQREALASQLERLQADRSYAMPRDALRAGNAEQEIGRVEGELRRAEEKIAQLELRAQVAGTLVIPRQDDLPGMYAKRGRTLGYILDGDETGVRAAVPERDAALVRERTRGVEVRFAEASAERRVGELVREVPAATRQLPSAALGDRGGGPHITDPADKDGLRALDPVVLIDLTIRNLPVQRAGGRVWIRFDHGAEPLAYQFYRRSRQLFLQHFDPTG